MDRSDHICFAATEPCSVADSPRVIFLDIDGVLNRTREATHIRVDADLVERLRFLVQATGANIVLSTFWRHFEEYIRYILYRHGIVATAIIGHTPGRSGAQDLSASAFDESQYTSRAAEIKSWLSANTHVTSFVILDDRPSAADKALMPRFVQTDATQGLSEADIARCQELLIGSGPPRGEERERERPEVPVVT